MINPLDNMINPLEILSPFSPTNYKANCECITGLNPSGLMVHGLETDSPYYEFIYMYACLIYALKEKALKHLTIHKIYQTLLNNVVNGSVNKREEEGDTYDLDEDEIKGGVKLNVSVSYAIFASLMGAAHSLKAMDLLRNPKPPTLENIAEVKAFGQTDALQKFDKHIKDSGPMRAYTYLVGEHLSKDEATFVQNHFLTLNFDLQQTFQQADEECRKDGAQAQRLKLFSNENPMIQLSQIVQQEEQNERGRGTQGSVLDYFSSTVSQAYESATTYQNTLVDDKKVLQKATEKYNDRLKEIHADGLQSYLYADAYNQACTAGVAAPIFQVVMNYDKGYSIEVTTQYGNDSTVVLLNELFELQTRIISYLPNCKKDETLSLQNLLERIQLQIHNIGNASIFAPLRGLQTDVHSTKLHMIQASTAARQFQEAVKKVSETLPLTREDAATLSKIRGSLSELQQQVAEETYESMRQFMALRVEKTLAVVVETVEIVAQKAEAVVEQVVQTTGNVAETITQTGEKVADQLAKSTGNVAKTVAKGSVETIDILTDGVVKDIYKILPAFGIVGLFLAIVVGLRRNPGRRNPEIAITNESITSPTESPIQPLTDTESPITATESPIQPTLTVEDIENYRRGAGRKRKSRKNKRNKSTKHKRNRNNKTRKYRKKTQINQNSIKYV